MIDFIIEFIYTDVEALSTLFDATKTIDEIKKCLELRSIMLIKSVLAFLILLGIICLVGIQCYIPGIVASSLLIIVTVFFLFKMLLITGLRIKL